MKIILIINAIGAVFRIWMATDASDRGHYDKAIYNMLWVVVMLLTVLYIAYIANAGW